MPSDVSVEKIAETEDSGEWVFRAESDAAWMTFIFPSDHPHDLWIHHVQSDSKGGMKHLLDYVCSTYDCRSIRFMNVISDRLRDALTGFDEVTERVPADQPSPMAGEPFQVLEGEWEIDRAEAGGRDD